MLILHAALALLVVAAASQFEADPTTSALTLTFAYLTLVALTLWLLKACVAALTVNGEPQEVGKGTRRNALGFVPLMSLSPALRHSYSVSGKR